MQTFIKKLFIFIALAFLSIIILYFFSNHLVKKESDFKTTANKIILGDSHAQKGINPALLQNTINMGNTSEALIYSYYKLKLYDKKQKLDTVFLSVSYHTFSDYYEPIIFRHDLLKRYFLTQTFLGQLRLIQKVDKPLSFIHKTIAELIRNLKDTSLRTQWIGGYINHYTNTKCDTTIINKRIHEQYLTHNNERNFSKNNTFYFEQIVAYCLSKNIKLIALNIPLHNYYTKKVPLKFKDYFYNLMKDTNTPLYEPQNITLKDEHFIPDGDHLSKEGVIPYTNQLKSDLIGN